MSVFDDKLVDRFIKDYLPSTSYYFHSDLDLFVNITISQILNYNELLSEEVNKFIQKNFGKNYKYYNEIKQQKIKALSSYKPNNNETNSEGKKTILSFDFPEFEIYFVAKLYIEGIERKPECQTKLLFNSENIKI